MIKTIFENIFTINKPLKKEDFFKYSFVLILFQMIMVWFFYIKYFSFTKPSEFVLTFILSIALVEIPFLYIYYVLSTKRIWDILGEKNLSLLLNIILMAAAIIILPLFPIIYIMLLLLPSKN